MSKPRLPTVLPSGQMLMHMRARQRHEIFGTAFEMCGGVDRLVHEANKTTDGYWELVKHYAKGAAKPVAVEHSFGESTEDMVDEADRFENAKVVNGTVVLDGDDAD